MQHAIFDLSFHLLHNDALNWSKVTANTYNVTKYFYLK